MSGISGIFYRDGRPVNPSNIEKMLNAIDHRGPDKRGVWSEGPAGLGHCMLYTTPESLQEKLPLVNSRGDLVITADLRIDNRDALISQTGIDRQPPASLTDSEIVLAAYDKWGNDCARYLLGDFSFAIWDKRKQQLYAATDHFRQKPFCYFNSRDSFIFSSQPSGLLPGNLIPKALNDLRLGSLFLEELAEIDKTSCVYKNVFYLPAASYLVADHQSLVIREYWNTQEIMELPGNNDADYQEEYLFILEHAVSCRSRSSSNTAIALSGGIDSTTVAAISNKISVNRENKSITLSALSANENTCRESDFINQSIAAFDGQSKTIKPESMQPMLDDLATAMKKFDSPQLYQNIFHCCLFNLASQNKARVILDGAESDTILGPGEHYIAHAIKRWDLKTALYESHMRSQHTENNQVPAYKIFVNALRIALFPESLRPFAHAIKNKHKAKKLLSDSAMTETFAEKINAIHHWHIAKTNMGIGLKQAAHQMYINSMNRPYITMMPVVVDMMASAFSIEPRHPYLDKRLVEFALGLPVRQKNRHGWEKYILRCATDRLVPDSIRWRKGRDHVGWEYDDYFIKLIFPELEAIINSKDNPVFEYFDHDKMRNILNRYSVNREIYDNLKLRNLFGLHSWLNTGF